jgi:hypothetical protein
MNDPIDASRVRQRLRSYRIDVDEQTAAALAAEAETHESQMALLRDYDLSCVDSAVEVTRRGRR